jgi:phosphoglycolate phosphatase
MPMAEPRFDLIAFDWDGTLFDSTALIVRCIQQSCADLGVAVPSDTQAAFVIGLGLTDALAHAAPGLPPERYPELGARYRHHYFERQHELTLFPGALEMLQALKARRQRIAVATGKARRGLDAALETVQLKALFDATRTADETASKPDPRMRHHAAAHADDRRHHARPAPCRQRRHAVRRRELRRARPRRFRGVQPAVRRALDARAA